MQSDSMRLMFHAHRLRVLEAIARGGVLFLAGTGGEMLQGA